MSTSFQVTFDAADPRRLADFWAVALGYQHQPPPPGYATWDDFADAVGAPPEERDSMAALVDPDGTRPRLLFQRVPEAKAAKNRVHLDVNAGAPDHDWDRVQALVARLVEAGGAVVEERSQYGDRWIVMTDPEGNELCVQ